VELSRWPARQASQPSAVQRSRNTWNKKGGKHKGGQHAHKKCDGAARERSNSTKTRKKRKNGTKIKTEKAFFLFFFHHDDEAATDCGVK
jgi:hypothetical protein